MGAEAIIYAALQDLAGGNVYPDIAPEGTGKPYIVYFAVGGNSFPVLNGKTPATRNQRMRINTWAESRLAASELMDAVFSAVVNPSVQAVPIGGPSSTYESDTLLYGSSFDFSITYKN
ncbi:DUF3168 domain-containing protein [Robbsia andropogonis]|uniref:DUF3168 domain-containing protein n=1 Tax=Robbsia andropogonis TaxID=28092 RepID=UPI002A6A2B64|nr:DUF3168 domain-containing protein [Robbsia andropogonis]